MNLERLISSLPGKVTPVDQDLIERAYRVAEKAHKDQVRASGEPYIQHCLAVASILIDLGMPVATVAAGLLHDTVEDSPITAEDIERDFGVEISTLVAGVTKLKQLPRVSHYEDDGKGEGSTRVELAKEKDYLTVESVCSEFNWSQDRALKVLKSLEESGVAKFRESLLTGKQWYFPSIK